MRLQGLGCCCRFREAGGRDCGRRDEVAFASRTRHHWTRCAAVPSSNSIHSPVYSTAGFDYPFNALSSSSGALGAAFSTMLSSCFRPTARLMLAANLAGKLISFFPFDLSAWMPVEQVRRIRRCFETMESETERILEGKKEEARSAGGVGLGLGIEEDKKDLMTLMRELEVSEVLGDELTRFHWQSSRTWRMPRSPCRTPNSRGR
jgi:hypothetical protein